MTVSHRSLVSRSVLLILVSLWLSGCESERKIYALTQTGKILGFDSSAPDKIDSEVSVSGLSSGESLVQIAYRPATGGYYCLTSEERLCTLDPQSGNVSLVGTVAFSSTALPNAAIDFNPVVDRLRVVANTDNLRVNPADGSLLATDTDLAYDEDDANDGRSPQLAAIAYDHNDSGAASTTLYGLDVVTQSLVRIGSEGGSPESPNGGKLFTIAKTSVAFTANAALDIEPGGDTAYAVLGANGVGAALYRLNLSDGNADLVGSIDDGDRTIISLAVAPEEKTDRNTN
ncbi:DUF4394 domain-containing protein [Stagnimonas aquatica]|uniref:DUF4394 domain-containing protein n=1 Tax=Stagnimonas aquatica TaxID=2689987 RepID=A0A3N0V9W9_9GAMM|nr:DUF4394 domain-containing protein [Stagnimonas aquatica]ROH89577.1 DUF4394 domain-containing protein [Stagnimonas aquatica]